MDVNIKFVGIRILNMINPLIVLEMVIKCWDHIEFEGFEFCSDISLKRVLTTLIKPLRGVKDSAVKYHTLYIFAHCTLRAKVTNLANWVGIS